MRILLTSNASHHPARGGATRSNLIWLEHLASAGHACLVVCSGVQSETYTARGVEILSVKDLVRNRTVLTERIGAFKPDFVLVSSEDLSHVLLREAHTAAPDRLVYLAHTPQFYPFGPASWNPDPQAAAIVRRARAIVAIGSHMQGYIREHLGCEAVVIHPPIYGSPPFARFGKFDEGWILMVNPCIVKGISIFLALARAFPELPFAALKGWGTTAADLQALAALPNVTVLDTVGNIEEALSRSRLLLMPSLWYEGFGLIAMEAMLRGLPVISSDSGGLAEAKRGTGFVIPVRPIERYESVFDENHMPKPVDVTQDIEPWQRALAALTGERDTYSAEAEASRQAAQQFVSGLRASQFEDLLRGLHRAAAPAPMRILLAHNSLYYPSHGGGDKSNRLLMEALRARGHEVRVVARIERFGQAPHGEFLRQLALRGAKPEGYGPEVRMQLNGVDVRTLTLDAHLRAFFSSQIEAFDPDVILTSTDDPAQMLLDIALAAPRARVVHLVRATIAVPFGPDSSSVNAQRTETLRGVDGVVGVSEYVARYVKQWGAMDAIHVPISLLEPGEYPDLGGFDNEFVTLANPCAVKGIAIFLALARRMPDVRFAAVPTWGTNAADLAALRELPNVSVLDPVDNIDDLLRRTKVLLVPSLWAEARSRIVVEAMSRGVPVIASDIGGIPEAKLGVPYLLPVNPIVRYSPAVDENMVPVAQVPEQDIGPWQAALERLLSDRKHYEELSKASRTAALEYARTLSVEPFERFLQKIVRSPKRVTAQPQAPKLSPEKQKLLALRLKQRSPENAWLPYLETKPGKLRLFCFPYAGAGALAYIAWTAPLAAGASVCPVRLPGRENRIQEKPFDRMDALVDALEFVMAPHLDHPFAFFGHSMGAGIAFELARALRRRGKPLPVALYVSGARAPQFRLNWTPPAEPREAEFLEQLRRLDGIPDDILANPKAMQMAMPALRADAALYRNYIYTPGEPLAIPIFAYGGCADQNVPTERLEAWREQTAGQFTLRMFEGGHFFIKSAREVFLRALLEDLRLPERR
jgi:surfactin synthase thioesterase subunit/glycosyltransferase involved in cell wall biosynthesis